MWTGAAFVLLITNRWYSHITTINMHKIHRWVGSIISITTFILVAILYPIHGFKINAYHFSTGHLLVVLVLIVGAFGAITFRSKHSPDTYHFLLLKRSHKLLAAITLVLSQISLYLGFVKFYNKPQNGLQQWLILAPISTTLTLLVFLYFEI